MINASFITVMILAVISWGVYRFILYKQNKKVNGLRESMLLLFLFYFLILLSVTVFKSNSIVFNNPLNTYKYNHYGIWAIINVIPLKETINTLTSNGVPVMMPIRNIVGNILLFMPLGFIMPMIFEKYDKFSKIFILGFVSSLSIEVVQLFVGMNVCDIDDVIYNTTGAILGLLYYKLFKKIVLKTKFNKVLENIKDYTTENIFNKSAKVLAMISVLVAGVYTYSVYDQTGSDRLSNEELAIEVFKDNNSKFIDSKDLEDNKFYLVKNEYGLEVKSLAKYGKSRYANSYEGYGIYSGDDVGYSVGVLHNLDQSTDKLTISVAVYGKNSNADKMIISLAKNDYEVKLNEKDYFLAVYPKYVEIDENLMNNIYNGINSEDFSIKFLDINRDIVEDMNYKIN